MPIVTIDGMSHNSPKLLNYVRFTKLTMNRVLFTSIDNVNKDSFTSRGQIDIVDPT